MLALVTSYTEWGRDLLLVALAARFVVFPILRKLGCL